jgi:NCS1 family nucleobase:cation symporter-1
MREIHHPDGRVELDDHSPLAGSPLYNEDLAPIRIAGRNWSTYNYAALWISMAHCIPTYMLASGLIGAGMSWAQALATILLGNLIVLVPILANSHPGTKYGISFPVFARAAYGTVGSNLPALMRAIVACGWFGIQCWIGGQALHTLMTSVWKGWPSLLGKFDGAPHGIFSLAGTTGTQLLCFLAFWALNIAIVYRGMNLLRKVENWAAPYVLAMTALLVAWALWRVHQLRPDESMLGPILAQGGRFHGTREFLKVFFPSLTAMIGFWATLSLNMPDFTRFGRSQREQAFGQAVALPTTMTVFAAMGVLITSASAVIYGKAIWDPVELVGRFSTPWLVAVSMFTVVVATLSVNIAANVVSPANDFANALPKLISFRTGGLITGIVGILMQPWRLIADPSGYIFQWLLGYSGGLGSIAGVLIADYWLVRQTRLQLADLYQPRGVYGGWSLPGTVATLAGCAVAWVGLVWKPLAFLFDYAWFVGFFVAGGVYSAMMLGRPSTASAIEPHG